MSISSCLLMPGDMYIYTDNYIFISSFLEQQNLSRPPCRSCASLKPLNTFKEKYLKGYSCWPDPKWTYLRHRYSITWGTSILCHLPDRSSYMIYYDISIHAFFACLGPIFFKILVEVFLPFHVEMSQGTKEPEDHVALSQCKYMARLWPNLGFIGWKGPKDTMAKHRFFHVSLDTLDSF